jgi:hypothetical protein
MTRDQWSMAATNASLRRLCADSGLKFFEESLDVPITQADAAY